MQQSITRSIRVLSLLLPALIGCVLQVQAQQFSIADGTISTCSGVLEDTGGPSGEYGNNENLTVTICPSVAGDAISLNWVVFALSNQGTNPKDRIRLWDGDNTSATFLGEYFGTDLQGLITSTTNLNTSGCITIQFTSNAIGTGNFAAGITCFTPCERPTAVATMSEPAPYPALVCVGEPIFFDGTASFAAPTFNIASYTWNFDDGSTATTDTATHSFSTPGEYIVQLNLMDDNGCVNSNVVDLQVLVSTTPSFTGTVESLETCLGSVVNLSAVVTPTTWTGIPEANFGDGVYLPDDLGIPFTSELTFTQFDPGQNVTNVSDILSVCTSMEHSFMGDLVIQLTCPNGQTMLMHQQQGGGTYIGGANDGDSNVNPVAGTCWNYCWSPTATWGTFAQCSSGGATPHVMQGGTPSNNALIPDTYTPVQPFTNMLGCPLNGTWTFTVTDLWAADNGFLCDWSINFDPAIIPDATQFTPVLGSTIDSSGWTGPSLQTDPNNPLVGQATLTSPGTYDYSFSVTDNFGCSYDTTISITILPQMVLDAGPEVILCNDSLPMAGVITANGPPNTCTWTIGMYDTFGDGWSGGSLAVNVNGVSTNHSNISGAGTQQTANIVVSSGSTVTLTYTPGSWNNEVSFTLFNDQGGIVYASPQGPAAGMAWTGTATCGGAAPVTFAWTPTNGLGDPGDPQTMVWVSTPTWYHLSVYPTGSPECAVSDSVLVTPPPTLDPGVNADIIICPSTPNFLMTDSLGGTPELGGIWTDAAGTVMPDNFTPALATPGDYSYTYTITSPAGCIATSQLDITVIPDTDPTCCGVPDAGPDNISCTLSIPLGATPGNTGVGQWYGPSGAVFADAMAPHTTVTMPAGGGGSHWFYWRENDGAFCNTVDSVRMTFTDRIELTFTSTNATCYAYCDGNAAVSVTGGNTAVDFTYAWSAGSVGTPDSISGLCMGTYTLLVTDDNGCTATDSLVITQPVLLQIDSLVSRPVTCSGDCDGQVEVYDPEAVAYSFDDGNTWSGSSLLTNACEGLLHPAIRNAAGCVGADHIVVAGPPPVKADFVWGPDPATVEAPTIYFHNTSTGAQSYEWDIASLAYSTSADTSFLFTNKVPGVYPVCLIARNYNNCPDTICKDVIIADVLEPYVPNAFTPNGDGKNDDFLMNTNGPQITDFQMLIYDRWGQLVFSTVDPYEAWQGSFKNSGKVLASGVYVYRIRYEVVRTQTKRELMGHVSLLK